MVDQTIGMNPESEPGGRSRRVALITGAAGGLGSALAAHFIESGWNVAATHHRTPLFGEADHLLPLSCDVTDCRQVEAAVSGTISRFGRLDVLINNAGVTADHLLGQLTEDDWRSVMEVNLKGAFLCSRAVIPQMIKQHDGHIINVSSYSARAGHTGQVNYAAAKAGLIGLTQALAREIGSRNVRANTVLPGLLKTAMTKGLSKDQLDALRRENALDRVNDVDEVAAFIGFLATTKNISGQLFQLDSRIAPWT